MSPFRTLARRLFRRFTTKKTTGVPNLMRFRPRLEQCEDRTVPTSVVTVQALADATEGGAAGTFRFTRTETSGSLYVSLMASGTATNGSDYTSVSSVSFANGQATVDLNVTATDDSAQESTETLTYTIVPFYIYTVGTPGSATINLYDNDTPTVTVAKIADTTEGGTAGTFRFTRTGSTFMPLTANFTVGGTASSGSDFTSLGTTVTFGFGQSTADVTLTALTDNRAEGTETVALTLGTGSGYTVGTANTATADIADDPPELANDSFTGTEDQPLYGNVLSNDSVVSTGTLSVTLEQPAWSGTVALNSNGTFTYTPNANAHGTDTFTYRVTDGSWSETATVTLTIQPVDDAPTIAAQTFAVLENSREDVLVGFVLSGEVDAEEVTYSITAGNSSGAFAINSATGAITVATPSALNYEATTSFALTVQVASGATPQTANATVTINVQDVVEVANETETDRILWLNEGYDVTQTIVENVRARPPGSFDPDAPAQGEPENATEESLLEIIRMGRRLDEMATAVATNNAAAYGVALGQFKLGVLNYFWTLPPFTSPLNDALQNISLLVEASEADEFRLLGIESLARDLHTTVGNVKFNLQNLLDKTEVVHSLRQAQGFNDLALFSAGLTFELSIQYLDGYLSRAENYRDGAPVVADLDAAGVWLMNDAFEDVTEAIPDFEAINANISAAFSHGVDLFVGINPNGTLAPGFGYDYNEYDIEHDNLLGLLDPMSVPDVGDVTVPADFGALGFVLKDTDDFLTALVGFTPTSAMTLQTNVAEFWLGEDGVDKLRVRGIDEQLRQFIPQLEDLIATFETLITQVQVIRARAAANTQSSADLTFTQTDADFYIARYEAAIDAIVLRRTAAFNYRTSLAGLLDT